MINFIKRLFVKSQIKNDELQPEASVIVAFDLEIIRCKKPFSKEESIRWDKLDAVVVETTDEGPMHPDVFWLLLSKDMKSGCIFPQGATGENELITEMQNKLPGFDNHLLIEAMGSTDNNKFLIWERKD